MYPNRETAGGHDLETTDGRRILELKYSLQSARDLDAALIRLASKLAEDGRLQRATLVARSPKMTAHRIHEEWRRGSSLFRSEIGSRLFLVALAADDDVRSPDGDLELRRISALAREAMHDHRRHAGVERPAGPWSPKLFDVWMVLLDAWLRCEPALPIKEILRRSGTSSATVKPALDRLHSRSELARTSDRRAAFVAFPRRSLEQILTLDDALRNTLRLVDASGRPPDPHGLLRRLETKMPPSVGIGGVRAARHYIPEFDLEGLPRVDVTVLGADPMDWLPSIDPGLRQARADERSPVLVIHRAFRSDPGFEPPTKSRSSRLASRADTLLDLYDLRLTQQAEDFVQLLRQGANR